MQLSPVDQPDVHLAWQCYMVAHPCFRWCQSQHETILSVLLVKGQRSPKYSLSGPPLHCGTNELRYSHLQTEVCDQPNRNDILQQTWKKHFTPLSNLHYFTEKTHYYIKVNSGYFRSYWYMNEYERQKWSTNRHEDRYRFVSTVSYSVG